MKHVLASAVKHGLASTDRGVWIVASSSRRTFVSTRRQESALIFGGVAVALGAAGVQYALVAYKNMPQAAPPREESSSGGATGGQQERSRATSQQTQQKQQVHEKGNAAGGEPTSAMDQQLQQVFAMWGGSWLDVKKSFFSKTYYDGGFEDKMTKREAALVLGVRETTSVERIKEAHRRVLLLNHPDRGGSAFIAAKVNEAKDLLLKSRGER